MKTRLLAVLFALSCVPASAQVETYVEASVGAAIIPTVDTKTYTFTDPSTNDVYTGKGFLNYSTTVTAGAEIGYAGFYGGNLRFGVAWDYLRASLSSAGVVGTQNGVAGRYVVSNADIRAAGFNFDDTVHIVGGNAYYNLPLIGDSIRPYVGAGFGAALIENASTEMAASATVGFRYGLADNMYIGARYRFYYITGPTDDAGVQYNGIMTHTLSAVLGIYMN